MGAGALTVPFAALAQQPGKIWRVGYLGTTTPDAFSAEVAALRAALREQGYEEGRNLVFDARWAEGKYERLPVLAAELVAARADVIVANCTPGTTAARKATATIPIVMNSSPTRSATAWCKAWRGRAATSPGNPT